MVSGCLVGVMLGRLVGNFLQSSYLPGYSWRFAFLLGFVLSVVGYFIRNRLSESPEFQRLKIAKTNNKKVPLIEGIKQHPLEIIAATLLIGTNGVGFYFIVVFFPDYIKNQNGIDIGYISLIVTLIPALLAPLMGWISDKWHRGKMLVMGIGSIGIYSVLALPLMISSTSNSIVMILILGYAVLFSIQSGTINTYTIEIFPVRCRFSCGALCYSLGMAVIGGTSPMVAAILIRGGDINNVVNYILSVTTLGFISGYLTIIKRKSNKNIKNIELGKSHV